MPTPTEVFAELAARHGGVDANDMEAVARWYAEEVPTLPREKLEAVLEELLRREGEVVAVGARKSYPTGGRIPALSVSRPAPLPLLAIGFRAMLGKMFRVPGGKRPPG